MTYKDWGPRKEKRSRISVVFYHVWHRTQITKTRLQGNKPIIDQNSWHNHSKQMVTNVRLGNVKP